LQQLASKLSEFISKVYTMA